MKAGIYIRVSTDEQIDGFSLSAQLKALREYCVINNIELVKEYADEGLSGGKEDRPSFQQMIQDAEKGLFQVILVHKFDRFARRVELSQKIKNKLKKSNVNVVSITEPIEDSPIGFFQEGLLELLSEYFIRNLSKEVKKGLVERASQGKHTGYMPYGYFVVNDEVKIHPQQADIVKKVFELYLDGWGYNKIAIYLNENRIPLMKAPRKNECGVWQHHQVDRMLRNVKYSGRIFYAGATYPATWKPIIDTDTFEKAQQSRGIKGKKHTYRGANFDKFFLLGILRCGVCNTTIRVQNCSSSKNKRKGSNYYYVCNYATKGIALCTHKKHYQTIKLTETIISILKDIIFNRKAINVPVSKIDNDNFVVARKEKISAELHRAKRAYLSGVFELAEYGEIKNKLEAELKDLNGIKVVEGMQDKIKQETVLAELKNVLDALEKTDNVNQKRTILLSIIKEIKISPDNIEIIYNI